MTLYIIEVRAKRKGAKWKPAVVQYHFTSPLFMSNRAANHEAQEWKQTDRDVRVSKVKVVRNG